MTLPHDNATATITIDGLAICCFNKTTNAWEIGYLHHPHQPPHVLLLEIENDPPIEIKDTDHTQITFAANLPRTPPFPGSPDGFFDPFGTRPDRNGVPITADEIEDFRWIINMQDPSDAGHGNATPKKASFPITRAFMDHAVLYTSRIISRPVFQAPFTSLPQDDPNNMNTSTLEAHRFGRTNDQTAADIFCDPDNGNVTLTIPGVLQQPRVLNHRPGNPWKISLTNLCSHPVVTTKRFEIGDFQLFYGVLTVDDEQAIWGEPLFNAPDIKLNAQGVKTTGRVDCDITWLGASESLDAIMP